jgi:cytochrome c556
MKKNVLLTLASLAAMAILFTSCAKLPEVEIANAKAAIEAAKAAEADRYVPAEYKALNDSLNVAMTEVENQKSKFALFRSYKKVTVKLNNVVTLGNTVKENAGIRKEEVKNEASEVLAQATTLVTEVKDLIVKAPKGKEGKEALEAIQSDLALVEASLAEVNTLMNNGDYLTALDKVRAANDKAASLKAELEEAIAKKTMRK